MENDVVYKCYEGTGYLSIEKSIDAITSIYWFSNLRTKVKTHIWNFLKCIALLASSGSCKGFLHIIPTGKVPFSIIHIDHLGPIDQKNKIKRYIRVVLEAFIRNVKLHAAHFEDFLNEYHLRHIIMSIGSP